MSAPIEQPAESAQAFELPVPDQSSVTLSVLDLAPIVTGSSAREALLNSIELARLAENLGYYRHWVAEHHNLPGVASSATSVLMAHTAAATSTIRIGSGGIMLPNHAPLVIAEQFGTLEALHPDRIDLGIGRAPGSDVRTSRALRRFNPQSGDDLPELLGELLGFFSGRFPEDHPYASIHAYPGLGLMPQIWLLGSSGYSAQLAGLMGLPFCFAHHFSAEHTIPALDFYRSCFRPSRVLDEPYSMIGVLVVCAPTDDEAAWLARPGDLTFIQRRLGRPSQLVSEEEAARYPFGDGERAAIRVRNSQQAVGSPDTVRDRLTALIAETGVNELMLATTTYRQEDRLRSFELVAKAWGLSRPG